MEQELDPLKKPYAKTSYTAHQLEELLKCQIDPEYFIENYTFVQHSTLGKVPLKLHDYQKEFVKYFHKYNKTIILAARQMGKCSTFNSIIKHDGKSIKIGDLIKNKSLKVKLVDKLESYLVYFAKKVK